MNKTPFIPPIPDIPHLSEEDIKNIDREKIRKSPAIQKYKKHLAEQRQREAAEKLKKAKERRSDWWKTNAIGIVTLLIALATLIVTAIK